MNNKKEKLSNFSFWRAYHYPTINQTMALIIVQITILIYINTNVKGEHREQGEVFSLSEMISV